MTSLRIAIMALAAALSQPVIAQDKGGNTNMEILRQK
jgi:hypothetical protein